MNLQLGYLWTVKMPFKIWGAVLLVSIYCCGIGVAGRPLHSSTGEQFTEGTYLSAAKSSMFCHIPHEDNSYSKINELPSPAVVFLGKPLVQRSHDLLLRAVDRQYRGDWINFLLRLKQAKLIFPFHSFL